MKTAKINKDFKMILPKDAGVKPAHHPLFPPPYYFMGVIGSRGSGKSIAVSNFVALQAKYNKKVYWCSPTAAHDPSVSEVLKKVENIEYIEEFNMKELERIFAEMETVATEWENEMEAAKLIDKWRRKYPKDNIEDIVITLFEAGKIKTLITETDPNIILRNKPCHLLVVDDHIGNPLLGSSSKSSNPFNRFAIKHRHFPYYCSLILLSQEFKSLNKTLRSNLQQYIIYPSRDITILEAIYKEVACVFGSLDRFVSLMNKIAETPHAFLFMDVATKDLREGFDQKIISW